MNPTNCHPVARSSRRPRLRRSALTLGASTLFITASFAQMQNATAVHRHPVVIQGLPDLPGYGSQARARGVSDGGLVVVGSGTSNNTGGSNSEGAMWTGGVTYHLGDLPGGEFNSVARGVSANGQWIVGSSRAKNTGWQYVHWRACSWNPAGILQELPSLPTVGEDVTHAFAASADGSVIVGYSGFNVAPHDGVAVQWTNGGAFALGWLPTNNDTQASDVSADGSVIVGLASGGGPNHGFLWSSSSGMHDLGVNTSAEAVSADGQWVVGNIPSGDAGIWHEATGWVSLGLKFTPRGVSADGRVVVGTQTGPGFGFAMIWTPARGARRLDHMITNEWGQSLGGWKLTEAWDVTSDGVFIVGRGVNPAGLKEGVRVEVRP